MATSGEARGTFSGRNRFQLGVTVVRSGVSGNSSRYDWSVWVQNLDNSSQTFELSSYGWSANIEGSTYSGNWIPDFRSGQNIITLGNGTTGYKAHNSSGALTVNFSASAPNAGIFGSASASGSFASDPLGTVPGQPAAVVFVSATPTSVTYTAKSPSDTGGSPLTRSQHQITLQGTGWDNPIQTRTYPYPAGQSSFTFSSGLSPAKTYAVRLRYENAIGWGPYSPTVYYSTLPATAPGISVIPGGSGTTAVVTLTPPSGVTGVDLYTIERRVKGLTSITTATSTSVNYTATGLSPGVIYEWRAKATFGGYTSPYSAWLEKRQPNPNTNPGDYFDGSSLPEAGSGVTFAWDTTGGGVAPNNARSTSSLPVPIGWLDFAGGSGTSGGTGTVAQITDAARLPNNLVAGTKAARVQFNSDTTAAGFFSGISNAATGRATVTTDAVYIGSMYVFIQGRQQRMAARITWYDGTGATISSVTGDAALISGGNWVRLLVTATSPSNAAFAAVRVVDVAGDGWSIWRGGDQYVMDAAMLNVAEQLPYFDGSFANDGQFAYDWDGAANASSSNRTTFVVAEDDPLIDPDCVAVPAPPRPPLVLDECIDDNIPTWRRYWYSIPADDVSGWLTELPTIMVTSGDGGNPANPQGARQVRIRIYPNPFGYSTTQIDTTNYCSEQIISYMPPFTTLTLSGPTQRVYAEVQGGSARAADHLLYGTGGVPATWPELTCGMSYLVSIDEPASAPINNIVTRLQLTRRT